MKSNLLAVVGVVGLASGAAFGQFAITPGGADAGNGVFANGTLATSLTGAGNTNADFRQLGTGSTDNLFQSNWWFRTVGSNREYVFANGSADGFTVTGTTVGNTTRTLDTGGYDFTVTGAASFSSAQRWQIFNDGTNGVQVLKSNTITNNGSTPLNLVLFSYDDFDVNGSAGGNTWAWDGSQYDITAGPITVSYGAFGFDARQTTAFSTLRGLLSNTAADNLNNTDAGSPGDFTGAFQWNLVVDPGASVTVAAAFSINGPLIPAPGAAALLGLGGLVAARRRRA